MKKFLTTLCALMGFALIGMTAHAADNGAGVGQAPLILVLAFNADGQAVAAALLPAEPAQPELNPLQELIAESQRGNTSHRIQCKRNQQPIRHS